jgi:assimilatory nitrate reductase catalytic subunit
VLLSRASVPSPAVAYWARYRGAEIWSYQLADEEPLSLDALRALLPPGNETDLSESVDENGSRYRAALWSKGRLVSYLWAASDGIPPVTHWIEEIFHRHEVATEERMALLAGRPLTDSAPAGRAVCACHGVDENAVCAAIAKGCDSIASIGEKTKAGTGCGACMPELSRLLSNAATAKRQ